MGTGFIDYPYVKTAFCNLLSYKLSIAIKMVPNVKFLLAFLLLLASTYYYKLFLSISLSSNFLANSLISLFKCRIY